MFATIRKHQTWLWAIIISVVIVSFVIFFTPTVSRGDRSGGGRQSFGTMNGRPITRKQYIEAYVEAKLSFFLRYGTWPDQAEARKFGFSAEREARNRLVLLDRLEQLNFRADEGAMAQWVLDRFSDAKHPGTAKANYQAFVQRELSRHGITEGEFERFVRHEIGIGHLIAVSGVTGRLVTPREATELFRQEQEKLEAELVAFSASNYLASITMDPLAVAQFYTNRQSFYRIPEKVQLAYVKFDLTNYLQQAASYLDKLTNLSAEIDRAYLSSGPSFFTDTNGQVMPPEAAKAKIRAQFRDRQALLIARKEAAKFANELDQLKPKKAENLANLAAAKSLISATTEPFSEYETPRRLRVQASLGELAFKLTPEEPFISSVVGEDGVYVVALDKRLPSELPALDTIRARVTEEYRMDQAGQMARNHGTNFFSLVTNGLAQAKSFAAICAEAKVASVALPKFAPAMRALPELDRRLDLGQIKAAAAGVAAGKCSEFMPTRDGGFVLFVKARTPVSEPELKQELPKFLASLRQSQQYEAFNEWFRKQLEQSQIQTLTGKDEAE